MTIDTTAEITVTLTKDEAQHVMNALAEMRNNYTKSYLASDGVPAQFIRQTLNDLHNLAAKFA